MASSMTTTALQRPMRTCEASLVRGRTRATMSTANKVAQLFSAAAMVLIRAASSPAEIRPRKPVGTNSWISFGSTWLALAPISLPYST